MDWGSGITYIAKTAFKGKETNFGLKDRDRLEHVSVIGKGGSGRAALLAAMALQDVERGLGTIVIDASGKLTELLLERLGPDQRERLIYLDPSDAEYPFSWNPMDDVRTLPSDMALPLLSDLITALYRVPASPFSDIAAAEMLKDAGATMLFLFELASNTDVREQKLPKGSESRAAYDAAAAKHPDVLEAILANGRYIARDTLMRNLLGQRTSKFTLGKLHDGAVFVVDLSRIKMFPTRLTPMVRLFYHLARMHSALLPAPPSLYLNDCIRCFSDRDIEWFFAERRVMGTMTDAVHIEEDRDFREKTLTRSGTVLSFVPSPADSAVVEKVFFPYVGLEDFNRLDAGEVAVLLTIDSVRSRPFFAHALPLRTREKVSYHDIQVASRARYTSDRHSVDRMFMKKIAPPPSGGAGDPAAFSSAFRSIFAKNAGGAPAAAPSMPPISKPVQAKTPVEAGKADAGKPPAEVSEAELKQMLYVEPLA